MLLAIGVAFVHDVQPMVACTAPIQSTVTITGVGRCEFWNGPVALQNGAGTLAHLVFARVFLAAVVTGATSSVTVLLASCFLVFHCDVQRTCAERALDWCRALTRSLLSSTLRLKSRRNGRGVVAAAARTASARAKCSRARGTPFSIRSLAQLAVTVATHSEIAGNEQQIFARVACAYATATCLAFLVSLYD